MSEINAKQELLDVLKENNLEIIDINCTNGDAQSYLYYKKKGKTEYLLNCYKELAKFYRTIDDFDFMYDPCDNDIEGTICCRNIDTKEPCWMTRGCDEASSWWNIHKVPEYFIKNKIIRYE